MHKLYYLIKIYDKFVKCFQLVVVIPIISDIHFQNCNFCYFKAHWIRFAHMISVDDSALRFFLSLLFPLCYTWRQKSFFTRQKCHELHVQIEFIECFLSYFCQLFRNETTDNHNQVETIFKTIKYFGNWIFVLDNNVIITLFCFLFRKNYLLSAMEFKLKILSNRRKIAWIFVRHGFFEFY